MQIYTNRELSWLKFNQRVLEEAENPNIPLGEKLNFLSIYQTNLDEFYMVRVGSLEDATLVSKDLKDNKTKLTPVQQIQAVSENVRILTEKKKAIWLSLKEELKRQGITITDFHHLKSREADALEYYFMHEVAPLTSPTVTGHRQPFPFLQNKAMYAIGFLLTKSGQKKLGILPCDTGFIPRLIEVPGRQGSYILSEELILHFFNRMFNGFRVVSRTLIRVTRNADIDADALYDEDLDYREFMSKIIRKRKRLSPVRMETSRPLSEEERKLLTSYIHVRHSSVFTDKTPFDFSFLSKINESLHSHPDLFYPKYTPQDPDWYSRNRSVFAAIREKDRLLSFPFESMKPFLSMLEEAASDPDVISIRMTLYRVAHHSQIVERLIEASENGKDVQVLVELKARFDEENNIEWSERMEEAGIRVIYGLQGYKVHSKLCLITRKTRSGVEYYTQIGTGNYNEKTARLYTDLSLLTADPAIGMEAASVLQALAKGETVSHSDLLLVAPHCLQKRIIELIDEQIHCAENGQPAYIGIKINSLTDKTIMEELIRASKAGVKIDMVVRGICCLLPGIGSITDHIHIISIVGRFLEHSRIYIFGTSDRQKVYISSADFMTRNTLHRVEIAVLIQDAEIRKRITDMFDAMLHDNVNAQVLDCNGFYHPVITAEKAFDSQSCFCKEATAQAEKRKDEEKKENPLFQLFFKRRK